MAIRRGAVAAVVLLDLTLAFSARASMPRAACMTGDRPESGLQGEVTAEEVSSGANKAGFTCNTKLVGQYQGQGASWQQTAWKTCAYFDQRKDSTLANPGSVVVNVSDPTHPQPTAFLLDPAMVDPWESLKINGTRQLIAADLGTVGAAGPPFAIYDISSDCAHPVLKSSVFILGALGHAGQWAPDGNTYYISSVGLLIPVDTTDPTNPTAIGTNTQIRVHDLEVSKDGNFIYGAVPGGLAPGTPVQNGLLILDVSDIQARRANPQIREVSHLYWDDVSIIGQNALPVTIAGKPYVIVTDEAGVGSVFATCPDGKSGHGFPHIVDVSDPASPRLVSNAMMEVAEPANCQRSISLPMTSTGRQVFGYSCHYCNVDDADDAKVMACNCFAAGLRVFDIHDPTSPKEMAYYKAPAQGTKALPASQYAGGQPPTYDRPIDWSSSKPSFPKDRGMSSGDIFMTSQDNGFQVISLSSLVTVTPKTTQLRPGEKTTLTAKVEGAASTAGVTWSVQEGTGGTVDASGSYTAPSAPGTYHVIATSVLDKSKQDLSTITVTEASGCSSTGGSSGLSALAAAAWLWSRRRRAARSS